MWSLEKCGKYRKIGRYSGGFRSKGQLSRKGQCGALSGVGVTLSNPGMLRELIVHCCILMTDNQREYLIPHLEVSSITSQIMQTVFLSFQMPVMTSLVWRRRPALFRMADAPATRACTLMTQATVWVSSHITNSWFSTISVGNLTYHQGLWF